MVLCHHHVKRILNHVIFVHNKTKISSTITQQWSSNDFIFMHFFCFFRVPSYISGVHILGEIFAFANPNIEAVTFCLCGWCVLGVCLLPAFTRLGHEHQDILSQCDGMHVCRLDFDLCSHPNEFWGNGVRTHANSKGKILSTKKFIPEEEQTHGAASSRTAIPTHYQRAIPAPFLCTKAPSTVTKYNS